MIRVHEDAIPAAVCARAVAAIESGDEDSLAAVSEELHSQYVHGLLCDAIADAGLSVARSFYLPDLSRMTHERARADGAAARSEPVLWPLSDGLCLVACLNDGAADSARTFARTATDAGAVAIGHRRGRVLVFPTSWTHDYVLRAGGADVFSLVAFAEVALDTRLYDLEGELTPDEHRCAELFTARSQRPPAPWFPAPPLGAARSSP